MYDLAVNLLASALAGAAVWLSQRLVRMRRAARRRAFFGLTPYSEVLLVVPRHASSPRRHSVHRRDVGALVALATIASRCGVRAEVLAADEVPPGLGRRTEFCLGGWAANERTAAHLAALLPGVRVPPYEVTGDAFTIEVGGEIYAAVPGEREYALVARVRGAGDHPLFLIMGQTSWTNLAAARLLETRHRELMRRFGADTDFCLMLRVSEPDHYGPDRVEIAADVTSAALAPPSAGAGRTTRPPTEPDPVGEPG